MKIVAAQIVGKMSLDIVDPENESFTGAMGISEIRKKELLLLHDQYLMSNHLQRMKTHDILGGLVALCDNINEVVFIVMAHSKYMQSIGQGY